MRRVLVLLLALPLMAPAAASADDVSLERAWKAETPRLDRLVRNLQRNVDRWDRKNGRGEEAVRRGVRQVARAMGAVKLRVAREEASSAVGVRARRAAVGALSDEATAARLYPPVLFGSARVERLRAAGRDEEARRLLRRTRRRAKPLGRHVQRGIRRRRAADRLFKQIPVTEARR